MRREEGEEAAAAIEKKKKKIKLGFKRIFFFVYFYK